MTVSREGWGVKVQDPYGLGHMEKTEVIPRNQAANGRP
jgi:hypothetical protein